MREYIFRGYDAVGDKGWVFGDLVHNKKVTREGLEDRVMVGGYEVVPESVGLFTGIHDKNGKEIFEGDVVCKRDLTFNLQYKGVVVYNSAIGCFRISSEGKGTTMRMGFEASDSYNDGKCTVPVKYEYEVVGNIYENRELLNNNE